MKVEVRRAQGYAAGSVVALLDSRGIKWVGESDDTYLVAEMSAAELESLRSLYPPCPHSMVVVEEDSVVPSRTDGDRVNWLQSMLPDVRELIDYAMDDAQLAEDFATSLQQLWNVRAVMQEIDSHDVLKFAGGVK